MKNQFILSILTLVYIFSYSIQPGVANPRGGKYITASGELKVLVVFAKFKDDTSFHPYWSADSYPSEMKDFVDPDVQKASTHYLNLTNYYNQMSFGKFKVIGKCIGAETPKPMSDYFMPDKNCLNRSKANTDILKSIDDSIDYREFDNWTYSSDYYHRNSPDGIVDMIIVIWRGLVFSDQWSGESSLGYGPEFLVENGQVKIRMGYYSSTDSLIFGSGVTIQYWSERSRERNFKNCIHEVAHWLIQKDHPYLNFNHTFWGMLTLGSEGICVNSIEREKLGWINPKQISDTTSFIELGDYITTSSSAKYHPPNGLPNEYFYFENHQIISIYDDVTSNLDDKGIFILQVSNNIYYARDCLRVLVSDGFWNWNSPLRTDCWGNTLPAFQKKCVNRNGFGNRDKINLSDSIYSFLYSFINNEGKIECNDWLHGYGFSNTFDTTFNDVFSTWSNPPAKTWNGQSIDFSMEVINQLGSTIFCRFINQNSIKSKPSKPALGQDPRIFNVQADNKIIFLVWGADYWDALSIEPDLILSELQIKIDSSNWKTIYSGLNRSWNDSNYVYEQTGEIPLLLRVRVCDTQQKWSMWSDVYKIIKIVNNTSIVDTTNQVTSLEYHLYQNYPNPFNQVTTIRYQLSRESKVNIKVYNILGAEVMNLVSERKGSGFYEIKFNAELLPTGIYIYRIIVGDFIETKKMVLLK